ncbi:MULTISPECIES: flagellin [unclassified Caulobacter]|uniref:flagellin n=1 Tax=unclassified Caulobacter TaxID=2648921 RepID=UPI000D36DBCB|nr:MULTISPECIES: flagellin [unclassified Caulobacter]PTS90402.1 flagellin [Caulobacter sp. HMWF009]PTT08700.1 flagellin [Caulobacter sp. HMWF025]
MMNSINTNAGALVALQNLNSTNSELAATQGRINTGKRVANAKDNGAIWSMAEMQSSAASSLNSVKDSLQRGQSTIDVALAAGDTITDLLGKMKEKALAASDTSLNTASFNALKADFESLRDQITKAATNAKFNGVSVADGTTAALTFLANSDGGGFTVAAKTLSLTGLGLTTTTSFTDAATAKTMIATITTALVTATNKLSSLGTASVGLDTHLTFVGKLQDSLEAGVGNLVDADLAKESAKLQSLQTKQQLGVQALSIANQTPQTILSLFK